MKYMSSSSSILLLIDNEQKFFILRQKWLAQPSVKQAIVTKSAATVDIITNVENNRQTTTPIMATTVKRKDNHKFENTIFIHCVHEARLQGLQRQIHEIQDSFFKNTDYGNIRLLSAPEIDEEKYFSNNSRTKVASDRRFSPFSRGPCGASI